MSRDVGDRSSGSLGRLTSPATPGHGAASPSRSGLSRATVVVLLALPFVVFYWAMPWLSSHTLGNDYRRYAVPQQLLLKFSLANGTFPLYVPRFAGGQSASALTQGQIYHPISHLAASIPGYWEGDALEIYTALCLLSLGFSLWALYRLLRELGLDGPLSVVASFATVFNMRMLGLFDYGASLQSYVGYLLLCVAISRWLLHGPGYARGLCIVAATYLVLCSGHPQMAYFGMGGGILVLLCGGCVLRAVVPGPVPAAGSLIARIAGAVGAMLVGVLLSAAYLAPFYFDFLSTAQRVGRDFSWVYTPFGTRSAVSLLHSLFRPFSSDVQGSFGGPALLVVPVLVPLLAVLRRPPGGVVITWLLAMTVLALALAETLPLYYLAWKYLPMFSSFRAPGRVTMMVPFLLLLILVWVCRAAPVVVRIGTRTHTFTPLACLGFVAAGLYAAYAAPSFPHFDAIELAPPARIHAIPATVVHSVCLLGIGSLVLLGAYALRPGRIVAAALILAVVSQMTLVIRFGTWIAEKRPTTSWEDLVRRHKLGVGLSREDSGSGMSSAILVELRRSLKKPGARPPLARLYWDVRRPSSREETFSILRENQVGVATIEERPGPARSPFPDVPAMQVGEVGKGRVRLQEATFNRFRFDVRSASPGLFVFGEPFSSNWNATVAGVPTPTVVANGAWLGLPVPAGDSIVDLRYDSAAARAGMLVSAATAWMITLTGALRLRRRGMRVAASIAATLAAAFLFTTWEGSLHGGRHLGTRYEWKAPEDPPRRATPPPGKPRGTMAPLS